MQDEVKQWGIGPMKIGFIGGGNMAQAILGGLMSKGQAAGDCVVVDPNAGAQGKLAATGVTASLSIDARLLACDVILLAVKPQSMKEAVAPLSGMLASQLIISIAAGVRAGDLSRWMGGYQRLVRAMPNTPALIQAGITGLYAMPGVSSAEKATAETLMNAVGKSAWFDDEAMLDAVTAVSGSGPAYVFYFVEALEQAAMEMGFNPEQARLFATETFLGGARLAAQSADAPATLRANVTSKRGTTERAIDHFESAALKKHFVEGVKAARARAAELGDEMGQNA